MLPKNDRDVLAVSAAQRHLAGHCKLKHEIRRLPPGLTLCELDTILGPDWAPGGPHVSWREFIRGKLRRAGKPHQQSRCTLLLTSDNAVFTLYSLIPTLAFHDEAETWRNADLEHLPPQLREAPFQRTPVGIKSRPDHRQGTIDQDPEFMLFLEEQTQPYEKTPVDIPLNEETEPITSTPLLDALREKKAKELASPRATPQVKNPGRPKKSDLAKRRLISPGDGEKEPSSPGSTSTWPVVPASDPTEDSTSQSPIPPQATKAFLKNARTQQGMTEQLILQALTVFGPVHDVTIDPRKGTAVARFKESEGLAKAVAAGRVNVAQGTVEVVGGSY
ncbi:hypothetical protein K470DRAFT_271688 [Piedraia hortae CBS 480.64]|uniref:UPF3 domain-containing protein n=1 Tax=Piedraia hortae CBS 480.64 TaxID=1314780 RepID=A0A6A7BVL1_9PEZI|nr:hypothetical protein K470DRAFT_271688 [Piedraia hortae CBS 480.64]